MPYIEHKECLARVNWREGDLMGVQYTTGYAQGGYAVLDLSIEKDVKFVTMPDNPNFNSLKDLSDAELEDYLLNLRSEIKEAAKEPIKKRKETVEKKKKSENPKKELERLLKSLTPEMAAILRAQMEEKDEAASTDDDDANTDDNTDDDEEDTFDV